LEVAEVLPPGFTYTSHSISGPGTFNSTTEIWDIGVLTVGSNSVLTINGIASGAVGSTECNNVTVSTVSPADSNPNNNSDSDCFTIQTPTTPAISKSVVGGPVAHGDTLTYTITITDPLNDEPLDVDDVLPTGLTYVAGSAGGTCGGAASPTVSGQTLSWTFTGVSASGCTVIYEAETDANFTHAPGTTVVDGLCNNATVSWNSGSNSTSTSNCVDVDVPDVGLAKSASPPPFTTINTGSTVNYTVTVTNPNGSGVSNFTVTDTLGNYISFVNGSTGGTCGAGAPTVTGQVVEWTVTSTAASCTITYQGLFTHPGAPGSTAFCQTSTSNSVAMTYTGGSQSPVSLCHNLHVPTATITKTGPSLIVEGATGSYTLFLNNEAGHSITSFNIQDLLSEVLQFVPGSAGGTCGAGQPTVTGFPEVLDWTGVTVAAGSNCTITYQITAPASGGQPGSETTCPQFSLTAGRNLASITWVNGSTYTNSDDHCAVLRVPGMGLTKASNFALVSNDSTVTFTITATSDAGSGITSFDLEDILPAGWGYVAGSEQGTCGAGEPTTSGGGSGPTDLDWTGISITEGSSCTIQYKVHINMTGTPGSTLFCPNASVTNDATATFTGGVATAERCVIVTFPSPDIQKTATAGNITVGDTATYTITISNPQGTGFTSFTVDDVLPGQFSYLPFSTSGTCASGEPTVSGSTLTFGPFSLPAAAGSSCEIIFLAEEVQGTGYSFCNTSNPANSVTLNYGSYTDSDTHCVTVSVPSASAWVEKNVTPATAVPGQTVTYEIEIHNNSYGTFFTDPGTYSLLEIEDILDPLFLNVNAFNNGCPDPFGAGPSVVGNTVTFATDLGTGQSCTIQITAQLSNSAPITNCAGGGGIDNTVTLNSHAAWPVEQHSYGFLWDDIECLNTDGLGDPQLIKAVSPGAISVGDTLTYTLLLDNSQNASSENITVTDNLPSGYNFVAGSSAGSCSAGQPGVSGTPEVLTWGPITVNSSSSCTISYQVVANPAVPANATWSCPDANITNSATITWTGGSDTDARCVPVSAPPDPPTITKTASTSSVTDGDTWTYTLTITNPAAGDSGNMTIVDDLPANLNVVGNYSGTCGAGSPALSGSPSSTGWNLTWNNVTVTPGTSCTIIYDVTTLNWPAGSNITCPNASGTNTATVTNSIGASDQDDACVSVTGPPIIDINKIADMNEYDVGDTVTYTLTIDATGVSCGQGGGGGLGGLEGQLDQGGGGLGGTGCTFDVNACTAAGNNVLQCNQAGSAGSYTACMTALNNHDICKWWLPQIAVSVSDTLPNGFTYVNPSTSGTCGFPEPTVAGQSLFWTSQTIFGGLSCTLIYEAVANPPSPGWTCPDSQGTNSASISWTYNGVPGSDQADVCVHVNPNNPVPTITKSVTPATINDNGTATYTVVIENPVGTGITSFEVQDTIAPWATYVGGSTSLTCTGLAEPTGTTLLT